MLLSCVSISARAFLFPYGLTEVLNGFLKDLSFLGEDFDGISKSLPLDAKSVRLFLKSTGPYFGGCHVYFQLCNFFSKRSHLGGQDIHVRLQLVSLLLQFNVFGLSGKTEDHSAFLKGRRAGHDIKIPRHTTVSMVRESVLLRSLAIHEFCRYISTHSGIGRR